MKRALTLSIGALALVGSTFTAAAADLGRPIGKAPAMAPPPIFNWTGFYIGVGLGARADENEWTTTCLQPVLINPTCAPPDSGFVAQFATANPTTFEPDVGFRVSGYVGYNWQFQNWVIGVEGDVAWADNEETLRGIPGTFLAGNLPLINDTASVNDKLDASFRGRVGYLFAPQALFYVTGGVAWLEKEVTASCNAPGFPIGWCAVVPQAQSDSNHHIGWTVGGGIEWMLTPNWILRAEYRYSEYQEETYTFFGANPIDSFRFDVDARTHTAYAGIAYKF
jgi:outer membrane immunogenic protein